MNRVHIPGSSIINMNLNEKYCVIIFYENGNITKIMVHGTCALQQNKIHNESKSLEHEFSYSKMCDVCTNIHYVHQKGGENAAVKCDSFHFCTEVVLIV